MAAEKVSQDAPSVPRSGVAPTTRRALARAAFVQDLLGRIEAATGPWAVRFTHPDGAPVAEVLAVGGDLCLVRLVEGREPLGERLRQRHPEAATAIGAAVAKARAEGRPLGDALADLGAMPASLVREALLDQFVEGLGALAATEGGVREVGLSIGRSVSAPPSAFAPVEIYRRAMTVLAAPTDDLATRYFDQYAERAARAVLVGHGASAGGAPVVVATRGFELPSVAEATAVARHVDRMARPTALFAAGEAARAVHANGRGVDLIAIAGRDQSALFLGLDPITRPRVLDRLWRGDEAARRPG